MHIISIHEGLSIHLHSLYRTEKLKFIELFYRIAYLNTETDRPVLPQAPHRLLSVCKTPESIISYTLIHTCNAPTNAHICKALA